MTSCCCYINSSQLTSCCYCCCLLVVSLKMPSRYEDMPSSGEENDEDDNNNEDNENENNNDGNDENENHIVIEPAYTNKKELKVCKLFGANLMKQALNNGWEDHEVARLLILISDELCFSGKSFYKFLLNAECSTPGVLSILVDEGITLTPAQLLTLVSSPADSNASLMSIISECMEQHLFDLDDEITLQAILSHVENFSYAEIQRFVANLCSYVNTKRVCGKVLNEFTSNMEPQEASSFITSIVYLDFFQDLKGNMESLLKEIPSIRSDVEALLEDEVNENGEIIYSDEDEHGNLKGFVCDDDEISSEGGLNYEDDEEKINNDDDDENGIINIEDSSTSPSPVVVSKKRRRVIDDDDDVLT